MLSRSVKYLAVPILLLTFCGILGCGGGSDNGNPLPPVTNITGSWQGEAKDPGVTGNYWYPIEFTFVQDGNSVQGISSFPGLARFKGKIDGYVLTIESTDIYAYITSDGEGAKEIRGSFTSAGVAGGAAAADGAISTAQGGQTGVFYLRRATDFGLL